MGIPDPRPSNYWGYYTLNQIRTWVWSFRDWDGSRVTRGPYYESTPLIVSQREGKSSNRRLPVTPGGALWIPPSAYNRSVSRFEHIQKGLGRTVDGHFEWEEDALLGAAALHFKANPEFWSYGPYSPKAGISVNKRARLITECLLKVKDQKMDLGASLAEAVQTYTMFARKAETFVKSLRFARNGNWRGAFKEIGASFDFRKRPSASGVYLEYTYGIAPLLGEIYGGWELLNEQLPFANFVHAVRKLSKKSNDTYVADAVGSSRRFTITESLRGVDKLSLTGKISSNYARDVARAGLSNPATIAWEVTPWSFLIDWGMPIGNVLAAMDAAHGLDFVGGYLSYTSHGTYSVSSEFEDYSSPGHWVTDQPAIGAVFTFSNVREVVTGWPFPQLYAKSPFSTKHATNALALLRQLSRSR